LAACGNGGPNAVSNAIGYATHSSRSHDAVIRVYDDAGNVIETCEPVRVSIFALPAVASMRYAEQLCAI
jgi:hypothetical protein